MTLISTSALRKITVVVLFVATVTFGAAEIHKRFFAPSQQFAQTQSPPSTSATSSDHLELIESIYGFFQKWEELPDSSDRYAFLSDPQTGELLPKIRVGFEFTTLEVVEGKKDITDFAIGKNKGESNLLFTLKFFTYREVDRLIKKEDTIKIFFKRDTEKEENLKDELGNLLAQRLLIQGEENEVRQVIGEESQSHE